MTEYDYSDEGEVRNTVRTTSTTSPFRCPIRTSRRKNSRRSSDVLRSPGLSSGPVVEAFEKAFAAYVGRRYAIAVPSGTLGLYLILAAYGSGRATK